MNRALVSEPTARKRGEFPHITCLLAVWVRFPNLTVLNDNVTEPFHTLVRLTNYVER